MSHIESELKLRLVDHDKLDELLEFLKELNPESPRNESLKTTYYDTSDYRFLKSGLSYRLRTSQTGIIATVKTDGQSDGGLHQRLEFNVPVCDELPDIKPFLLTPVGERLRAALEDKDLIPVCSTAFSRHALDLTVPDGSEIELAVDCGEITASQKMEPILEIELELKKGSNLSLIKLGAEFSRKFPLLIELDSKLARALALAGIADKFLKDAERAAPIIDRFEKEAALSHTAALLIYLIHQTVNKHQAFLLNRDCPPALHRLRIALRKLRTILSFAKPVLAGDEFEKHQAALKEFSLMFGELRDFDDLEEAWHNFAESSCRISRKTAENTRPLSALLAKVRKKDTAKLKLHRLLSTGWATPIFLEIWVWLEEQIIKEKCEEASQSLGKFTKERLREWLEEFIQNIDELDIAASDSKQIYKARILNRRIYYVLSLFSPVLNKHTQKLTGAMKKMQNNLGLIRDAELSLLKLSDFIKPNAARELYYDAGLFAGSQAAISKCAEKDFVKLRRKVKKISRKWLAR